MGQFLFSSLKQINCTLSGHDVSVEDEKSLFKCQEGYLNTKCVRCDYPLILRTRSYWYRRIYIYDIREKLVSVYFFKVESGSDLFL